MPAPYGVSRRRTSAVVLRHIISYVSERATSGSTPSPHSKTVRREDVWAPPRRCETRSEPERKIVADEPIVSGMAARYATALFDLALEKRALDKVATDLAAFETLL